MAAQNPDDMPAHAPAGENPGKHREVLGVFAGKRAIEGHNLDGAPDKPGAAINGTGDFKWLDGDFFLHGIERVHFEDHKHVTMMVFSYEDETGDYVARFCDNNGFSRDYVGRVDGDTWHFAGKFERVRIEIENDGRRSRHFWERTENGEDWAAICEFSSTRID